MGREVITRSGTSLGEGRSVTGPLVSGAERSCLRLLLGFNPGLNKHDVKINKHDIYQLSFKDKDQAMLGDFKSTKRFP